MTVSIVMPAYNALGTIFDAIDSALTQTRPPLEVIVIDDGSTDGTADAIESRYSQRVSVIRQTNAGVSAARNRGIEAASGDFVHFLDADDMLNPDKLERSIELAALSGAAVVYGPARYVASDGVTPVNFAFPPLPSGDVLADWLFGTMANGTYGVCSSFLVSRAALRETGGFNIEVGHAEDWDLWIRLAAKHRFVALDEPLVTYRVMPTGASRSNLGMAHGRLTAVRRARALPEVRARFAPAALDRLEAGRWHVYAMRLWEAGRRSESRRAFAAANRLAPSTARRLYALMTYVLPAGSTAIVGRMVQLVRQ